MTALSVSDKVLLVLALVRFEQFFFEFFWGNMVGWGGGGLWGVEALCRINVSFQR